jgi:hypothetical protein
MRGFRLAIDEVLAGGAAFLPVVNHVLQVGNQKSLADFRYCARRSPAAGAIGES